MLRQNIIKNQYGFFFYDFHMSIQAVTHVRVEATTLVTTRCYSKAIKIHLFTPFHWSQLIKKYTLENINISGGFSLILHDKQRKGGSDYTSTQLAIRSPFQRIHFGQNNKKGLFVLILCYFVVSNCLFRCYFFIYLLST